MFPEPPPPIPLPRSATVDPDAASFLPGGNQPGNSRPVEERTHSQRLSDLVGRIIVCALALLLAATPARNSDLWLHLASGRELVHGQSRWGVDPFASTTTGVFWVNHTWLSDILLYGLYALGDGRALALAKSVLLAILAGMFFGYRRQGTRVGIVSLTAAVAVLALGPWLPLQPILLSLLGVASTLYLLERPSLLHGSRSERARAQRWLLVPLFALWANLDGWFLLGPLLVGLYTAGEALCCWFARGRGSPEQTPGGASSGRRGDPSSLLLLTLAGSAACLLTPYHYRIFAWPTPLGLSHAEQVLRSDPLGRGLVVSPFHTPFATAPAFASPGGWAYCLLLVAGVASYVLRGRDLHPGRLLVWLALAALSLYQARAIPFFAMAAGPILALNIQEWVASRRRTGGSPDLPGPGQASRLSSENAARGLGLVAGLALLVLAWPGWLQPVPYQPRSWSVEPDASVVRLARKLASWHDEHRFQPGRFALTFSPAAAHYLAWFCPPEKGFLDARWPLFDRVADDFVRMRHSLLQPTGPSAESELGPLLDAHHIDRIVLYDPDWPLTTRAFRVLLQDREWELLAVEGTAALFGRRPPSASPPHWKPFDYRHAAFEPNPDRLSPPNAPRPPQLPGWLDPFTHARDERPPDRGEAALHLLYFDVMAERMRLGLVQQWLLAQAGGLAGTLPGSESAGTVCTLALRLALTPRLPGRDGVSAPVQESAVGLQQLAEQWATGFLMARDRGPPEALLLAVRAARRALARDPDDAAAFLLLGEAYLRLTRQTRDQSWQTALPLLAAIRRAQTLTALEQAVFLRPDLDEAHASLAQLYYEGGQLDHALDHLRARRHIAERQVAAGGPDSGAAAERFSALRADVDAMTALVERSLKIYEANTQDKTDPSKVLDRARLASRHGLTGKALEMLLASYPAIFGKAGAQMQLELMLQAGRAFEVRTWLEPSHEAVLGFSPYHSLQGQAVAACGDYAGADAELGRLSEELRQVRTGPQQVMPVRSAMGLRVGGAILAHPLPATGAAGLAGAVYQQFQALQPLGGPAGLLRQEADMRVLRGVLALESGAVENARQHFHAALNVWDTDNQTLSGAGLDFPGRTIAQQALPWLEGGAVHAP
jgi:tetratricopeptide (TPR) repeat protein